MEQGPITQLRKARGWSQLQLARAAKLSQGAVSDLESGKVRPRPETLAALASALGVDVADLIEAEPAQPRTYPMARNVKPEEVGQPVAYWVPVVRDIARAGLDGIDPELVITRLPVPPEYRERGALPG